MITITVPTEQKRQILDITALVEGTLVGEGIATIFVQHTTAAITTADLDPGTDQDLLDAISAMTPGKQWNHPHNPSHFPDHLWGSLFGPSLSVPFKNSKLQLGTWQRIIFIELDGPRARKVMLHTLSD